jgi:hypothetical protein
LVIKIVDFSSRFTPSFKTDVVDIPVLLAGLRLITAVVVRYLTTRKGKGNGWQRKPLRAHKRHNKIGIKARNPDVAEGIRTRKEPQARQINCFKVCHVIGVKEHAHTEEPVWVLQVKGDVGKLARAREHYEGLARFLKRALKRIDGAKF